MPVAERVELNFKAASWNSPGELEIERGKYEKYRCTFSEADQRLKSLGIIDLFKALGAVYMHREALLQERVTNPEKVGLRRIRLCTNTEEALLGFINDRIERR